jgi:hypothetical protein
LLTCRRTGQVDQLLCGVATHGPDLFVALTLVIRGGWMIVEAPSQLVMGDVNFLRSFTKGCSSFTGGSRHFSKGTFEIVSTKCPPGVIFGSRAIQEGV